MRLHTEKVHKKHITMNNDDDDDSHIEAYCHEILEKHNKENVLKTFIGKKPGYLGRDRN